jgi:AraC family transcriptional regulator
MKPETLESYQERLVAVLIHIQEHLDEPLPLERLAAVACFSPYHFHRIFRGMVGESVHEHVRRLRLERAAMQLKQGSQAVTQIAFGAGYESHEAFTRAFHGLFGASPSEFRSSVRSLSFPSAPSGAHFTGVHFTGGAGLHPFQRGGEMELRVETLAPQRVAFMRHVGSYAAVGTTWGKLYAWAGRRGYFPPRTRFLAVVHDDPEITPADRLRYDACFVVDDRFQPQGEVGVQELAGGEYAVAVHTGPYETLGETYARVCGEWAPRSGRGLRSAPAWEVYLNDPRRTRPELLRTEIYLPLEPREV